MRLLTVCLSVISLSAFAYTIQWNHFADNGSFVISSDLLSLGAGNLPPDGNQSTQNCSAHPIKAPWKSGFTVNCNGKVWIFDGTGSRFACSAGGGGHWASPDGNAGAFLCN